MVAIATGKAGVGCHWDPDYRCLLSLLLAMCRWRGCFWAVVTPVGPLSEAGVRRGQHRPRFGTGGFVPWLRSIFRNDQPVRWRYANMSPRSACTLFGIRANESSGGGSAIIAGEDGVQNSYAVGEEVAPGVILDSVAFDHVILSRGGVKESLYLDQSVPADTVGTAPITCSAFHGSAKRSAHRADVAINAETIQKSIGFAPRNEGGRVTGLVLQPRDDGTMMRIAGFQAGDIIVAR